jgi:hypothetical protein
VCHSEGHGRGEELGEAAPRNPPGYRERNVQKVSSGTGEALPGPATAGVRRAITGEPREVRAGQEGGGWGRSSDDDRDNTTRFEGRTPAGATREKRGGLVNADNG